MRSSTVLLVLTLTLAACAAHDPPRCDGKLEPINPPVHARTVPDGHGQ